MKSPARPLSPHLQIYRWQLTAVLSILHRASGIWLSFGAIFLVWWLLAAAFGPAAYHVFQGFFRSPPGLFLVFLWTAALFYHLCNGVRHLTWDCGWGFELRSVYRSGWAVLALSTALTVIAWVIGYFQWS